MKGLITLVIALIIGTSASSQDVKLIPKPVLEEHFDGYFEINESTVIFYPLSDVLQNEAHYLRNLIGQSSTFNIQEEAYQTLEGDLFPSEPPLSNFIILKINTDYNSKRAEAYTISITKSGITIQGATKAALMRGIQTLRQMLSSEFHSKSKRASWRLPCIKIGDYPEFNHRGFMLDVCRHFFEVKVVKEYIDLLAFYRMNVLHLHLTEDQGWRFASEKYPLLNTISSTRTELNGEEYGGLFSKDDLKEIVAYAAERHIEVIPEIEMPGHSQAALAAYPHLSCTGENVKVANDWGVFKEIYCAGNDSTFMFLEDILLEVIEIFPSKYIHIGGDEAPKQRWEQCSKCQKRIEDEGLEDEQELQSYFIKRIERFLLEHDRRIIGWDEILEGGLSEYATVQSWRGFEGGMEAAQQKNNVIMSPTSHCYLDYGLKSIDLEKIYEFDPVPTDTSYDYYDFILGAECNMWTEHVPDKATLDKMVFPRMIGFAEAIWSGPYEAGFEDFYSRIQTHYPVLDVFGIQYGEEMTPVKLKDSLIDNVNHVVLEHKMPSFSSNFKWESEKIPTPFEPYTEPIPITKSGLLTIQPMKNGLEYGEKFSQEFVQHQGVLAEVHYQNELNKWYTAGGERALVNGKKGSLDFRDGNWQGFWGDNLEVELSFDETTEIEVIQINFYHYANAWIIQPKKVMIQTSKNGKKWSKISETELGDLSYDNTKKIVNFTMNFTKKRKVKFIRAVCENSGKMPEDHDAAGEPSWIFIDEIIVK